LLPATAKSAGPWFNRDLLWNGPADAPDNPSIPSCTDFPPGNPRSIYEVPRTGPHDQPDSDIPPLLPAPVLREFMRCVLGKTRIPDEQETADRRVSGTTLRRVSVEGVPHAGGQNVCPPLIQSKGSWRLSGAAGLLWGGGVSPLWDPPERLHRNLEPSGSGVPESGVLSNPGFMKHPRPGLIGTLFPESIAPGNPEPMRMQADPSRDRVHGSQIEYCAKWLFYENLY
jgi:hypothetical protein